MSQPASETLPTTTTGGVRTYVVSGGLGTVFFVTSGLLWAPHPFLGSLFLELGGGAFIVFLLDFLLPSALGYADDFRLINRPTEVVWLDPAVEALLVSFADPEDLQALFQEVVSGRYPSRARPWRGVRNAGAEHDGAPVLRKSVKPGGTELFYSARRGAGGKTVTIADIVRSSDETS